MFQCGVPYPTLGPRVIGGKAISVELEARLPGGSLCRKAAGRFLTCGINALSDNAYVVANTPDRRADGRLVAIACPEPRT